MSDCQKLEPVLTAYVDGEAAAADRAAVDVHLGRCPACRSRVDAEHAVRTLLQDRRPALANDVVPAGLRARCAGLGRRPAASPVSTLRRQQAAGYWRARAVPLALAASLVLAVAATFLYQATSRSSRVLAAELTADHVKCFAANRMLGLHGETPAAAERYLATRFAWNARLPQMPGLALEAARPCLYGEGRAAHVMYRYGGQPVSLFMLPGIDRREEIVDVMGHRAAIWSADGRTFVLIAPDSGADIQRLAAAVHDGLR